MKPHAPGAIASLVCGILAIVLCAVPLLGLLLGVAAIVTAVAARRAAVAQPEIFQSSDLPVAALVCGIVGAVLSALSTIWWLVVFSLIGLLAASLSGHATPHLPPVQVPML